MKSSIALKHCTDLLSRYDRPSLQLGTVLPKPLQQVYWPCRAFLVESGRKINHNSSSRRDDSSNNDFYSTYMNLNELKTSLSLSYWHNQIDLLYSKEPDSSIPTQLHPITQALLQARIPQMALKTWFTRLLLGRQAMNSMESKNIPMESNNIPMESKNIPMESKNIDSTAHQLQSNVGTLQWYEDNVVDCIHSSMLYVLLDCLRIFKVDDTLSMYYSSGSCSQLHGKQSSLNENTAQLDSNALDQMTRHAASHLGKSQGLIRLLLHCIQLPSSADLFIPMDLLSGVGKTTKDVHEMWQSMNNDTQNTMNTGTHNTATKKMHPLKWSEWMPAWYSQGILSPIIHQAKAHLTACQQLYQEVMASGSLSQRQRDCLNLVFIGAYQVGKTIDGLLVKGRILEDELSVYLPWMGQSTGISRVSQVFKESMMPLKLWYALRQGNPFYSASESQKIQVNR